jgi:hypothetical protein
MSDCRVSRRCLTTDQVTVTALCGLVGQAEFRALLAERDTLTYPRIWRLLRGHLHGPLAVDAVFPFVPCGALRRNACEKGSD